MKNIKDLLLQKSDNIIVQLFRYTIVGGLAFVVDYGLLIALTEVCGLNYIVSATISFVAGLLVNYLISVRWVFTQSSISDKRAEFLAYATVGVVGLGFNDLFIYTFTSLMGIHYSISKLISTVLVYAWNFFARRFMIFNKNVELQSNERANQQTSATAE